MFSNIVRLGRDRRTLQHTPGLRFWRLMGTGNGRNTGPSADLRRRAMFAVWDDDEALDRFLAESSIGRGWARAEESWHVRLHPIAGRGTWQGRELLADLTPVVDDGGPICTLTRATVRPQHWITFAKASRSTSVDVAAAKGLVRVVAVGEAPVGKQATFSLWENEAALRTFAYRTEGHVEVMKRTRQEGWYSEELFARFKPYASTGSWDGSDPWAAAR